jgi:hypothetical protein
MTYKPEPKVFELELYEGAYPYWGSVVNSVNTSGFHWTLDPSAGNSNALPYVRRKDTIGMIQTGARWGIPAGSYKLSVEFSQKWDVTVTSASSTLVSSPLSGYYASGLSYTIEADRFEVEAYDTGREVSTGYNIFYYRAAWLINITTSGTHGLVPVFGNTYLSQNGFPTAGWEQYMRRTKIEKIEDVTI